jgi:hypothetical protein
LCFVRATVIRSLRLRPIDCTVHSLSNMQTTFALAALAAVAYAAPQGVTVDITPTAPAPAGCTGSYNGQFEITVINGTTAKRDLSKRQSTCGTAGYLTLTLAGGQLTDAEGRTGYIASNYQFQFDKPPQNGAIYTGGFSVCSNGSLALGGSTVFYECLSGGFYNLYNTNWAAQCQPIFIDILPCGSSTGGATQATDGQPEATTVLPPVTQITDGQPQAHSAVPVSEYTDGQPQVITAAPKPPVTQISDGQVQAPTSTAHASPVTQISDGQVQAPTSAAHASPVTQISDGQVQAPTATAAGVPVSQISDGQVQATTAAPKPTTTPVAVVTQISDGQIQASGAANATTSPIPFTGVGNVLSVASSFAGLVVGIAAVLLL